MVLGRIKPDRLQQAVVDQSADDKILLEAGVSVHTQFYDTRTSRNYTNYLDIPRISEQPASTTGARRGRRRRSMRSPASPRVSR